MLDLILPDSPYLLKMIQIGGFILGSSFLFYALLAGMKAGTNLEHQLSEEVAERDDLEKDLKDSNQARQQLEKTLRDEQQHRAALQQETTALREQAKPRMLSETQLQNLIEGLAPLRGRAVQINSSNDAEARDYAVQIKNAFVEAGVGVGGAGMRVTAIAGGPHPIEPRGIVLKVRDITAPPREMEVVSEAFKAAGIPYRFQASQEIEIFIGAKPPPVK